MNEDLKYVLVPTWIIKATRYILYFIVVKRIIYMSAFIYAISCSYYKINLFDISWTPFVAVGLTIFLNLYVIHIVKHSDYFAEAEKVINDIHGRFE